MKITLTIIAVTILIFGMQSAGIVSNNFAFMPASVYSHPYTIITAIFLHGGMHHLLLNMLGLFMFGVIVEHELGGKKWLVVYFFSGIVGNLGYMLFTKSPFIPALGASGAIFGLIGAAAVLKPKQIIYTPYGPFPMMIAAILWGVTEILTSFGIDNIAHSAHIFGLIGGALIVYAFKKEIKEYAYLLLLIIPIILILAIGIGMPHEINGYNPINKNCSLIESKEDINFKYYFYRCNKGYLLSMSKPSVQNPKAAYYYDYFPNMLIQIYGKNCSVVRHIEADKNVISMYGTFCNHNFSAIAKSCNHQLFEVVQIYKDKPFANYSKLPC